MSDEVTAEYVAELHKQDLEIQDKFSCKGLTYWFDDIRKKAFCLVEAPDRDSINNMHKHAHGGVPSKIIEVEANVVESFLGRIEDPENIKKNRSGFISEPAYRIILVINLKRYFFDLKEESNIKTLLQNLNITGNEIIEKFNGSIINQCSDNYLVSFISVSHAVNCALEIKSTFEELTKGRYLNQIGLTIGLSSGDPVTNEEILFERTIKIANRICMIDKNEIILSSEVADLYKKENFTKSKNDLRLTMLTQSEEKFLNSLMRYTEDNWKNEKLKVSNFHIELGYSKSQFYRKIIPIFGKSPNEFLKEYRLKKSMDLLIKKDYNISEVSFMSGFSSPSYFTKCFLKRFGINPSEFQNIDF